MTKREVFEYITKTYPKYISRESEVLDEVYIWIVEPYKHYLDIVELLFYLNKNGWACTYYKSILYNNSKKRDIFVKTEVLDAINRKIFYKLYLSFTPKDKLNYDLNIIKKKNRI